MKKLLCFFLYFCLCNCSITTKNSQERAYSWMENDKLKLNEWIDLHDHSYKKLKDSCSDEINYVKSYVKNEKKYFSKVKRHDLKKVGDYYFLIQDKGIFYTLSEEGEDLKLFIAQDSLSFKPEIIDVNYSNNLVIKGSEYFNDEFVIQIWDILSKKKVIELNAFDFPRIQASTNNLYYLSIDNGKTSFQRFNFFNKKKYEVDLKNSFYFKVIDSTKLLSYYEKRYHYLVDNDESIEHIQDISLGTDNKIFNFISFEKDLFFYKTDLSGTDFYKFNLITQKKEQILKIDNEILISDVIINRNLLYYTFVRNGKMSLNCFNLYSGHEKQLLTDKIGTIGLKKSATNEVLIAYTTFNTPERIYTIKEGVYILNDSINTFNFKKDFKVCQKWIKNEVDSIPVLFYYKDSLFKSKAPLILYAYGGFGRTITPEFSFYINSFIENGGVYAIAGVRGGGENGLNWHNKGKLLHKKNSFEDFNKCLDFIIDNAISEPSKMAILGASNGGLLVNYAINNFSDKFCVAVGLKGLSDMVDYVNYNNGYFWISEYGNPRSAIYRSYLRSYSPLHNISHLKNKELTVLLVTGDKDDRVSPFHSYKFAYGLEQVNNNVYLNVIKNVGHKMDNENESKLNEEIFGILFNKLGVHINSL